MWCLLPTDLKAQSTLQIESDLILSAVLTGLLAQLATAVIVITKFQGFASVMTFTFASLG